MGSAKTKKWICHGLVFAMCVSLLSAAPDSSAAKKNAKLTKKKITMTQGGNVQVEGLEQQN